MSDRVVLSNLRFDGVHGYLGWERQQPQPFEVDIELHLDLRPAGLSDDLAKTVDYRLAYDVAREVVEDRTFTLIEAIAEAIAAGLLDRFAVDDVVVRVRKPGVQLGGPLDHAAVEIVRRRTP
jgi:dihydroneopterin aldolase